MFASAFVFVPLLAFAAMTLYIVLVFAAHYFLTLVECTAQGQREFQWPGDSFFEWLIKPIHLVWIGGMWVLPAILVSGAIGRGTSPYLGMALAAVAFAVLFPFGALSAFMANSVWMPFHPKAIALIFAKPLLSIKFYLIGISACVLGIGGGFLAMFSREIGYLGSFVGGVMVSLAWFVYACALGRLLYAMTYVPPAPRKKRKKRKKKDLATRSVELAEPEPEVPHWEKPKPAWNQDADDSPYLAREAEVVMKDAVPDVVRPKETEMKLLTKDAPPPPPGNPFADAFMPMTQSETMRNAILLAIMVMIQSGLVRMLIEMNPR